MARITVPELRRELRCDPETGDLWWINPGHKRRLDRPAGSIHTTGKKSKQTVRSVTINYQQYYAHILVWALVMGKWPRGTIDHIDLNTLNNRFANLREATRSQQNMNRHPTRMTGASFHKPSGLWQAYIKKGGKRIALGYFKTIEEAHDAYRKAAIQMFEQFAHHSLTDPS